MSKKQYAATCGTYSKAIPGALALVFSTSGGANCSDQCKCKHDGTCYAIGTQTRKPSIRVGGEYREKQGFAKTCLDLAKDLAKRRGRGDAIPWVRLSTFGSVPNRPLSNLESEAFKHMMAQVPPSVPVHFPVETEQKRLRYQALCDEVGLGHVVRISAQSLKTAAKAHKQGLACSTVWRDGKTKRERIANAKAWAEDKEGVTVCPAISADAKCGACTACAEQGGLVIYPRH